MDVGTFFDDVAVLILHGARFDILFGVVPGSSGVGGGDGHLYAADDGSGEEAGEDFRSEGESEEEGGQNDLNLSESTSNPGAIISLRDAMVEILMQAL